jgi:hypothetical protein
MNTSPTSSHPAEHSADDLLTLSPEPLSAKAREARDAMLPSLRSRVSSRRRRRHTSRFAAACVLALAIVLGARLIPATSKPTIPVPEVARHPLPSPTLPPVARPTPAEAPPAPPAFAITVLRNDPTIASRYTVKPASHSEIIQLTDDQLLAALEAAGTPGFIQIGGRVVLSRDLDKPKPEDTQPRSSLPADPSHG